MSKKEIKIKFKTITPLWTGDAWQKNREIRPSSLMGSLRFWFEVICYFSGICDSKRDHFNHQLGRFEKEVNRKEFKECLLKEGNSFETKIKCLLEQGIPWPSIVFGTTNWKSLIKIKEIKFDRDNFKDNPSGKIIPNKNFFWGTPSFQGEFEVIFEVEEKILEPIFYPLLTFMHEYGFWGGKWNIGYGRLEVLEVKENDNSINSWRKEVFLFSRTNGKYGDKSFECFVRNNISEFNILKQKKRKIQLFISHNSNNSFVNIVKELLKTKVEERAKFRVNAENRHKLFGKTGNQRNLPYVPQGSKILPYISEIERDKFPYNCGFLSVAGLLNLEGKK